MMGLALAYPEQCAAGIRLGASMPLPASRARPDCVVVAGMGGSAAAGELLGAVVGTDLPCPLIVHRDYGLPGFVGVKSLVIAVSHSGDTEEALSAFREAGRRGARRLAICSGGALARVARRSRAPLCLVPGGQPPRTASGYLFFPLWLALQRMRLLRRDEASLRETLRLLRRMAEALGPGVATRENRAKQIALWCRGKVPVIYGWQGFTYSIALRWKTQFNENAKVPAFAYALPEMNHNEIVGWQAEASLKERFGIIWLRDHAEPRRIAERFELSKRSVGKRPQGVEEWSVGVSAMARAFSLWYLGDLVSIYLALSQQTDPTPISSIVGLKRALARRS